MGDKSDEREGEVVITKKEMEPKRRGFRAVIESGKREQGARAPAPNRDGGGNIGKPPLKRDGGGGEDPVRQGSTARELPKVMGKKEVAENNQCSAGKKKKAQKGGTAKEKNSSMNERVMNCSPHGRKYMKTWLAGVDESS